MLGTTTERSEIQNGASTLADDELEKDFGKPLTKLTVCETEKGTLSKLILYSNDASWTAGNGDKKCVTHELDCATGYG